MIRLLRAEWLKTKRGALRLLVFGVPVLCGAVLAWYISGRPWIAPGAAFSGFFWVWAALVLPLALAIVAGQLVQEEELAGAFHGLLLSGCSRALLYTVKLVLLLGAAALATALAIGSFLAGLGLGGYASGGVLIYAQAGLVAWLAAIPLAACSLWISFAAGMGVAVGVGMGGMLIAALIGGTLIGDAIWPFVPWAWPVRLSHALAIVQTPGMDAALLTDFLRAVGEACVLGVFSSILLIVGGLCWFSRWDGRDTGE